MRQERSLTVSGLFGGLWHSPARISAIFWGLAGFMVAYGALLALELSLRMTNGISPIALSAGLAVGLLVRLRGVVQAVFVAAQLIVGALVGVGVGIAPLVAVSSSVITTGATLVVVILFLAAGRSMPRWGAFAVLVLSACVVGAIGASVTVVQVLAASDEAPADVWQSWWVAFSTGVIFAAPAVLMFRRSRVALTPRRFVELSTVIACTIVMLLGVLGVIGPGAEEQPAFQFFLIPLALWCAVRFGMAITAAVVSIVDIVAVIAAHSGLGTLSSYGMDIPALLAMQLGVALIGLAVYAIALNEEQRRSRDLELAAANGLVDSLLVNSDAMISIREYDSRGRSRYALANPRFARALGMTVDQIVGRSQTFVDGDPRAVNEVRAEDLAVLESNRSQVFITRSVSGATDDSAAGSGGSRVYLTTKFPVASADGESRSVGSIALDITDHRRRERLMRLTFDESPVPMVRMAWRNGRAAEVLDANRSAAALLRVQAVTLVGASLDRFTHPEERGISLVPVDGEPGQPRHREARLVRGDGADVWVAVTATVVETLDQARHHEDPPSDDDTFALVVLEDISARRLAEQTLTHQALHDALTGVLNRYAFIDRLESAINRLWRDPDHIAVLFCDLDGFKNLNDTLGHRAGDQMLISVSERLRAVMRPQDTVARLGGDEFVLICTDLPSPGQARVIGERIREAMRQPFRIDDREYGVTVSVGIATTTDPKTRAEDLLRRADLAMYRAKDNGRNRVEYYAEELEARAVAHVEATETLRRAIAEDLIRVHYQPIVDLSDGRIVGIEALARIQADDGSLVHPATFIGVAETSGLVTPMGERVLEIALDQLQQWSAEGIDVQLNVNVSPRQLAKASFAPMVFERLMSRGIAPKSLCLEITEGAVVEATGPTLITLRRLRSYGVHVGIDDFGTGFSSLTTLKYLPADVLKVDRSFVEGLGEDANDSAIVGAVIQVAHDLGCIVVAEGVELELQESELLRMGCDLVQGYRYGRPVSAGEMSVLLQRGVAQPIEVDLTEDLPTLTD